MIITATTHWDDHWEYGVRIELHTLEGDFTFLSRWMRLR